MNSLPLSLQRAVQRARWLAELTSALDHAGRLTLDLFDYGSAGGEAAELRAQILALRAEVDSIQRKQPRRAGEMHPNWMQ